MHLILNDRKCEFISLQTFRSQWGLPQEFGITYFEAKDWQVGALDTSGHTLARIKQKMIEAVPQVVTAADLFSHIQALAAIFRTQLQVANKLIGLREVEIDYAVDGFQNVLDDVAYRLVELIQTFRGDAVHIREHFDFSAIYQAWLDASARLLTNGHLYIHGEAGFEIRVIYNAYGRIGFQAHVEDETYYVLDPALACPVANYMEALCREMAQALCQALTRSIP